MRVFKLFFEMIKANIGAVISSMALIIFSVIIYFAVDLGSATNTYEEAKVDLALNIEEASPLIGEYDEKANIKTGLVGYLANYVNYKDVGDNLEDAMYFAIVNGELRLPSKMYEKIVAGEQVEVEFYTIFADESVFAPVKQAINNYLSTFELIYNENNALGLDVSEVSVAAKTLEMLSENINDVIVHRQIDEDTFSTDAYFNFASYVIINAMFTMLGPILLNLSQKEILDRIHASSYPSKKVTGELILSSAFVGILSIVFVLAVLFALSPGLLTNFKTIYMLINLILYTLASVLVVLLFSNIITQASLPAIANAYSLTQSFLIGAFIPRFLVSGVLDTLGHVFPGYYFISNNHLIANKMNVGFGDLYINWIIMGGFIVGLSVVIGVINRLKLRKNV